MSMTEKEIKFIVENDNVLSEELKKNLTRRFYRHLKFINAKIFVNGMSKKNFEKIYKGDIISIKYNEATKDLKWPEAVELPQIVYENENYLIVNKKANLMTIPTKACPNSLYQQICTYLNSTNVHILNRLDFPTSGLVLVAKNRYAASLLSPTHEHIIRKYLCLVEGIIEKDGKIVNNITKSTDSNKRVVCNDDEGQIAISNYKVLKNYTNSTLLEFTLETGRTHQIRVHTSNMGHPIIGDSLYANYKDSILCLTSYYIEFKDPFTFENIQLQIEKGW